MNLRKTTSLLLALSGLTISSLYAANDSAGVFDFGSFKPGQKGEYVEVNLEPGLLSIASKMIGNQEPEVAQLIRDIKQIRVNVAKLDDTNREQAGAQIAKVCESLTKQGWQAVVKVRESNNKEVNIFVKTRGDEAIEGIVVAVMDNNREAVLVNIVGNIRPENIGKIAEKLDIEPLKKLKLGKHLRVEATVTTKEPAAPASK